MSVVVAYRRGGRVALACDSMISDHAEKQDYGRPKWLLGKDGWLLATVGDLVETQDAERRWRAGRMRWSTPEERVDKWAAWCRRRWPEKKDRPAFLVASPAGGAWFVDDDGSWIVVESIMAIGSAAAEAKYAALTWAEARPGDTPLHVVEVAVKLATRWNKDVAPPVYGILIGAGIESPELQMERTDKL